MGSQEHGSLPSLASGGAQTPPAEHESGVEHCRYDARHTHRRGAPRRARCRCRPDGGVGAVRGPGRPGAHLPRVDCSRPAGAPGDGAPLGDRGRARRRPAHRRRRRDRGRGACSPRPGRLAARRRPRPRERAGVGPRRPRRDDLPQAGPAGPGVLGAAAVPRDHRARPRRPGGPRGPAPHRRRRLAHRRARDRRHRRAARRLLAAPHQRPSQRIPLHSSRFGGRWPGMVAHGRTRRTGDPPAGGGRRHPRLVPAPCAARPPTSTSRCGTAAGTVDDPTGLLDAWRERGAVTW